MLDSKMKQVVDAQKAQIDQYVQGEKDKKQEKKLVDAVMRKLERRILKEVYKRELRSAEEAMKRQW